MIGIDNIYFSNFTTPPLSTMGQPTYTMGKRRPACSSTISNTGNRFFNASLTTNIQRQTVSAADQILRMEHTL